VQKRLLVILTPILVLVFSSAATAAEVLQLTQHAEIAGNYEVLIGKDAIKASNEKTGITMYSQAPRWHLVLCNDHRKVYAKMLPKQFTGKMARAITNFDTEMLDNLTWTPDGKGSIAGLPVTILKVNVRESDFREDDYQHRHNRIWTAEYYQYIQHGVPTEVCHAFQHLLGVPPMPNVPIRVVYFNAQREKTTGLETFKAKRINVNLKYSVPSTYKQVKTEMDVFATPANNSGLDFFRQ
jgi:hypothetical protein